MVDTSLLPFAYAFLALTVVVIAAAVVGILVAVRELRGADAPVVVRVTGPQRDFTRAA
jgi:hypothetical protein